MSISKLAKWVMASAMLGALVIGQAGAAKPAKPVQAPAPVEIKLDNATCLGCHDGSKDKLEITGTNGEKRPLYVVKSDKLAKSVHAEMSCISCHKEIVDSVASHKKAEGVAKPNCVTCHESLWETAKKENLTKEKERLGLVVNNIESYKKSFHALPGREDKTKPKAYCEDCHNTHSYNIPPRGTVKRAEWKLTTPNVCGEKCHSDELEEFTSSIHGKELLDKKNLKAPACINCHTTHDISSTSGEAFKVALPKSCGNCHDDKLKSYRDTYHGQVNELGFGYTAKCYDCHGSHGILPTKDPESKVNPKNRLKTCQQCHDGKKMRLATEGFVTFSPHAHANDFERYPEMFIVTRFMGFLMIAVFTFFWMHSIMWFYREYKERQKRSGQPYVSHDALPIEKGKYFQRFAWPWRVAHLFFALSVMILILTGMAALYSQTSWAAAFMHFIGGPHTAGIIHRISATTMLSIFGLHLVYVVYFLIHNRKTFKWFGPTSLLPRPQDLFDAIGMLKWGFGMGPRPAFDRWTYWEKFDYWAVFWGMAIIGGSGTMLVYPEPTAAILPGWVFNVGTFIHGEEALLAAVFLFTVHFFNNHLRPEKMPPPDVVMFTGAVDLNEFKHEHWDEYKRLADSGELGKHLVNVPSRPMTIASRILGLVLLAFGFTLLILVMIGFFDHIGS